MKRAGVSLPETQREIRCILSALVKMRLWSPPLCTEVRAVLLQRMGGMGPDSWAACVCSRDVVQA